MLLLLRLVPHAGVVPPLLLLLLLAVVEEWLSLEKLLLLLPQVDWIGRSPGITVKRLLLLLLPAVSSSSSRRGKARVEETWRSKIVLALLRLRLRLRLLLWRVLRWPHPRLLLLLLLLHLSPRGEGRRSLTGGGHVVPQHLGSVPWAAAAAVALRGGSRNGGRGRGRGGWCPGIHVRDFSFPPRPPALSRTLLSLPVLTCAWDEGWRREEEAF